MYGQYRRQKKKKKRSSERNLASSILWTASFELTSWRELWTGQLAHRGIVGKLRFWLISRRAYQTQSK
jgi:hypothetical protein